MNTTTINEVKLEGFVSETPELKTAKNGSEYCRLKVETHRSFVDKNGEVQQLEDLIPVMCWRKMSVSANRYLGYGSIVTIEGRIEIYSKEYKDRKEYLTQVVCTKMEVLGKQRHIAELKNSYKRKSKERNRTFQQRYPQALAPFTNRYANFLLQMYISLTLIDSFGATTEALIDSGASHIMNSTLSIMIVIISLIT